MTPTTWQGWVTLLTGTCALLMGVMGTGVKLFGLDTVSARVLADQEIERDMTAADRAIIEALEPRLAAIEQAAWCVLWEVEPETCRLTYLSRSPQ